MAASGVLEGPVPSKLELTPEAKAETIENIRLALYASKIVSYAQGFMLMKALTLTPYLSLS